MSIRKVSEAADSYVQALGRLRLAHEDEEKAQQAASHLEYCKKEAISYREALEGAIAEALEAKEIP